MTSGSDDVKSVIFDGLYITDNRILAFVRATSTKRYSMVTQYGPGKKGSILALISFLTKIFMPPPRLPSLLLR